MVATTDIVIDVPVDQQRDDVEECHDESTSHQQHHHDHPSSTNISYAGAYVETTRDPSEQQSTRRSITSFSKDIVSSFGNSLQRSPFVSQDSNDSYSLYDKSPVCVMDPAGHATSSSTSTISNLLPSALQQLKLPSFSESNNSNSSTSTSNIHSGLTGDESINTNTIKSTLQSGIYAMQSVRTPDFSMLKTKSQELISYNVPTSLSNMMVEAEMCTSSAIKKVQYFAKLKTGRDVMSDKRCDQFDYHDTAMGHTKREVSFDYQLMNDVAYSSAP
eukprot:g3475.t1 g3475   contig12:2146016-2146837(+)